MLFPLAWIPSVPLAMWLFLAATRSSGLFFLGRSATAPVTAPASQPFNSNQFTLARDPNPSCKRILVSTTEAQDLTL